MPIPVEDERTSRTGDAARTEGAPRLRACHAGSEGESRRDTQPQLPAPVEPALDDETQKFIAQSLTDVDLFASYGLTQKAIGLLEAILRRAPRHTPTLEKLLDFVLGAGDDRRTAELAAKLEQIYGERDDAARSRTFCANCAAASSVLPD